MNRRWLYLAARNFGDALIGSGLVRRLVESFPGDRVEVWTRPQFSHLFRSIEGLETLHPSQFPLGTRKNFNGRELMRLLGCVRRLRRERFDVVVNDAGDVRDCFLGWLAGGRRNAAPVWPVGHPILRTSRCRGARRFLSWELPIPPDVTNMYLAVRSMGDQLGCRPVVSRQDGHRPVRRRVGLHPFATRDCRMWPWDSWRRLASALMEDGYAVLVFGAPAERPILEAEFKKEEGRPGVEIVTTSLESFLQQLDTLDLMVALDSFGIHAAAARHVPSLLINGASNAGLWKPPEARGISNGGQCPHHPCYCRPLCPAPGIGLYACIREIRPESVIAEARGVLAELGP